MLGLLATLVVLSTEPSAANLAPRFVQVQAASPAQQPTVDAPTVESYAGWSRGQLDLECQRLEDLRPSPGLGIGLLAGGAAILVIDLVVVLFAGLIALTGSTGLPVQVTAGIAIAAFVGAGMIIVGVILLVRTLADRKVVTAQMDVVKEAIERLGADTPAPPEPAPTTEPPPAMPFPQQVQWAPSFATFTLARF